MSVRLSRGSHSRGEARGCANNLISYLNHDEHITDYPSTVAAPLARLIQVVNDIACSHDATFSGELCEPCSDAVWSLARRTIGTRAGELADMWRWAAYAVDEARRLIAARRGGAPCPDVQMLIDGNGAARASWSSSCERALARLRDFDALCQAGMARRDNAESWMQVGLLVYGVMSVDRGIGHVVGVAASLVHGYAGSDAMATYTAAVIDKWHQLHGSGPVGLAEDVVRDAFERMRTESPSRLPTLTMSQILAQMPVTVTFTPSTYTVSPLHVGTSPESVLAS